MRWTEAPHGAFTHGNRSGGARSTPPFVDIVNLQSTAMLLSASPDGPVVVRLVCYDCGWQRIVGHCGWNQHSDYWTRSLIKITSSSSDCNLVHTVVCVNHHSTRDPTFGLPFGEFRDLDSEAREFGLFDMLSTFHNLLVARKCPRCAQAGNVKLSTFRRANFDVSTFRTWRIISTEP